MHKEAPSCPQKVVALLPPFLLLMLGSPPCSLAYVVAFLLMWAWFFPPLAPHGHPLHVHAHAHAWVISIFTSWACPHRVSMLTYPSLLYILTTSWWFPSLHKLVLSLLNKGGSSTLLEGNFGGLLQHIFGTFLRRNSLPSSTFTSRRHPLLDPSPTRGKTPLFYFKVRRFGSLPLLPLCSNFSIQVMLLFMLCFGDFFLPIMLLGSQVSWGLPLLSMSTTFIRIKGSLSS